MFNVPHFMWLRVENGLRKLWVSHLQPCSLLSALLYSTCLAFIFQRWKQQIFPPFIVKIAVEILSKQLDCFEHTSERNFFIITMEISFACVILLFSYNNILEASFCHIEIIMKAVIFEGESRIEIIAEWRAWKVCIENINLFLIELYH